MMPAPREIVIGGSGTVHTSALAKDAEISIGGSGSVEALHDRSRPSRSDDRGIGRRTRQRHRARARASLVGSGDAEMPGLKVDKAGDFNCRIGQHDVRLDGEVRADIMGSGNVTVRAARAVGSRRWDRHADLVKRGDCRVIDSMA